VQASSSVLYTDDDPDSATYIGEAMDTQVALDAGGGIIRVRIEGQDGWVTGPVVQLLDDDGRVAETIIFGTSSYRAVEIEPTQSDLWGVGLSIPTGPGTADLTVAASTTSQRSGTTYLHPLSYLVAERLAQQPVATEVLPTSVDRLLGPGVRLEWGGATWVMLERDMDLIAGRTDILDIALPTAVAEGTA
jgi:hypothetical protein